jgi:hypothetical protein
MSERAERASRMVEAAGVEPAATRQQIAAASGMIVNNQFRDVPRPIPRQGPDALVDELHGPDYKMTGAPGGIRTPDLWLRRPMLYPAELRARDAILQHW